MRKRESFFPAFATRPKTTYFQKLQYIQFRENTLSSLCHKGCPSCPTTVLAEFPSDYVKTRIARLPLAFSQRGLGVTTGGRYRQVQRALPRLRRGVCRYLWATTFFQQFFKDVVVVTHGPLSCVAAVKNFNIRI